MGDKGATLVVLLVFCLVLAVLPNIGMVEANGTIYIRADGSVEGTDKIQRDGDVYTFTDTIYDSLVVERDDIVVDGAGHSIEGPHTALAQSPEGIGILLEGRRDVTIRNVTIQNFLYGIYLNGSSNNHIAKSNITNNSKGIYIEHSSENVIRESQITENYDVGIHVYDSSFTVITVSSIVDNPNDGISFFLSSASDVGYCHIRGNGVGIRIMNYSGYYGGITAYSNITSNGIGIHLEGSSRDIGFNNIENNEIGIQIAGSDNKIDHNNFINNAKQVYDIAWDNPEKSPSVNRWYEGDTGNYWSDYNGTGPYVIDENNQDNFPTSKPLNTSGIPPPLDLTAPIPFSSDGDDTVLSTSNIFWSITIIAVVGAVLLFYFGRTKNKKHRPKNAEDNPVNEANSAFMQHQ